MIAVDDEEAKKNTLSKQVFISLLELTNMEGVTLLG